MELSDGGHEGGGATEALRRKLYRYVGTRSVSSTQQSQGGCASYLFRTILDSFCFRLGLVDVFRHVAPV